MTAKWLLKTMAALCREHGLCKDTVVHEGYLCPRKGDSSEAGALGVGRGIIKGLHYCEGYRYHSQNDETLQKEYFKWERQTVWLKVGFFYVFMYTYIHIHTMKRKFMGNPASGLGGGILNPKNMPVFSLPLVSRTMLVPGSGWNTCRALPREWHSNVFCFPWYLGPSLLLG